MARLKWTEELLRDQCWAERRWWWMPGRSLKTVFAWLGKRPSVNKDARLEIDAAAFTFRSRKNFDKFRRAFPDPPRKWMFDRLKSRNAAERAP